MTTTSSATTRARRAIAVFAALVAVSTGSVPAAASGTDTGARYGKAEFQRDVRAMHALGVIGVQGRVHTDHGTWTASSGVADLRTRRPVPRDGHYRIASNTKTFVATVVLQLVAEHRIRLDDPVDRYLPGVLRGNGNDGRRITVRQLLQHTSGLPDYLRYLPTGDGPAGFDAHRFDHFDDGEMLAAALAHPSLFPPGTGWRYSNTGYLVAGMIIEKVTGRHWSAEVNRRIVTPLRLTHTSVPLDNPWLPEPHARAYQQWRLGGPVHDVTEFNTTREDAAGGVVSTTADLSRFFRALLSGDLLPAAQLAEMRRTVPADGGVHLGYGLGLYRNRLSCGGSYWDHGGNTAGSISRGGVSADGRRSVALSFTGATGRTREDIARLQASSEKIVDRVLCGTATARG